MPAILTHYVFALDMLPHCYKGHKEAIFIGTQGPDPFFFYGQRPWKRRSDDYLSVDAFGSYLHHTDIAPIYATMMKIAREDEENKELYFSYIQGLWLHYCLDRECHAYIFPASGFNDKDEKSKKRYSVLHSYFETMIDSLISHKAGVYTTRPQKYLSINDDDLRKISLLWHKTNQETIKDPSIKEDSFYLSLKDYQAVMRMTNTPHLGSKLAMNLLTGRKSQPSAMNIPYRIPKKLLSVDFLNETHASWPDMISGGERNESFAELMGKAKNDFLSLLPIIEQGKEGADVSSSLHSFVGVLCHDGCDPSLDKRYSSPRWSKDMLPE